MKKIMLLLALCLGFVVQAFAIDSTALFDNKVLGTDIGKSSTGGVPVGTIIAWPASSNPEDPENWLECNGQTISPMAYLELFAVVGSKVPDMRNQFMRGGTASQVGQVAADSMRSHAHAIDQHTHAVSGNTSVTYSKETGNPKEWVRLEFGSNNYFYYNLSATTVTNPIDSSMYLHYGNVSSRTMGSDNQVYSQYGDGLNGMESYDTHKMSIPYKRYSENHTASGAVNGVAHASGPTATHATGSAETAPQHIRVRYLIRALP